MALKFGIFSNGLGRLFKQAVRVALSTRGPVWAIEKERDVSAAHSNLLRVGSLKNGLSMSRHCNKNDGSEVTAGNLMKGLLTPWPCIRGSAKFVGGIEISSQKFCSAAAIRGKENGVAESSRPSVILAKQNQRGVGGEGSNGGLNSLAETDWEGRIEPDGGDRVKSWPVDADLDEDFETSGQQLLSTPIPKSVLYKILKGRGAEGGGSADEGWGPESQATREDALRVFNLLQWQATATDPDPLVPRLDPLLRALAAGGLRAEINSLWIRYKPKAKYNFHIVPAFQSACLSAGMYDEVVEIFQDVQKQGWGLKVEAADMGVQAMKAQRCSRDKMWPFYRKWVEETGFGLQRLGFQALLKSGVTVDEIRSLRYEDSIQVWNRLIQALSVMKRQDEALPIVRELVDKGLSLTSQSFVSMLRTFVQSGFVKEAKELVDRQTEMGKRLDGALTLVMKKSRKAKFGLDAYRSIMKIEGVHKTSLPLHAMLIINCYGNLEWTQDIYEAYLLGKRFGQFRGRIMSLVIQQLAWSNRIAEAEQVLADYWTVRKEASNTAPLANEAFERALICQTFEAIAHLEGMCLTKPAGKTLLVSLSEPKRVYLTRLDKTTLLLTLFRLADSYLRDGHTHKLVKMVWGAVSQKHYLRVEVLRMWVRSLESKGRFAEADVVRKASKEMDLYWAEWDRAEKERKAQERLEALGGPTETGEIDEGLNGYLLERRSGENVVNFAEISSGGVVRPGGVEKARKPRGGHGVPVGERRVNTRKAVVGSVGEGTSRGLIAAADEGRKQVGSSEGVILTSLLRAVEREEGRWGPSKATMERTAKGGGDKGIKNVATKVQEEKPVEEEGNRTGLAQWLPWR